MGDYQVSELSLSRDSAQNESLGVQI